MKVMSKRGQVTIFIIIAILIVSFALVFFFVPHSLNSDVQSFEREDFPVYVQNCLDAVSKQAIITIGQGGGYYVLPDEPIYSFPYLVPVYIDKNAYSIPDENIIEEGINLYIEDNLRLCFEDFFGFKERGFTVTQGEVGVLITIREEEILINAKIPLSISKEDNTDSFLDFSTSV